MRNLLLLSFLLVYATTSAQKELDVELHRNTGYLGASVFKPFFIGKGYQSPDYWRGVHFKSGLMFANVSWGQQVKTNGDSTSMVNNGVIASFGIRASKPTTHSGRLNIVSAAFRPKIDMGVVYSSIPKDTIIPDLGDRPMAVGFHLSPGVIMRLSSVYVIASVDADAMVNWIPFMSRANRPHNLGHGVMFTPSVTIGFDNAWEILQPKRRRFAGSYTYTEYTETRNTYVRDYSDGKIYHITAGYTQTKVGFYDYVVHRIDPYWGFGPAYTFFPQTEKIGTTALYGLAAGFKLGLLKVDALYLQGQKGMLNGIPLDSIRYANYNGKPINYVSSVAATEKSIRAGINLANLLRNGSYKSSDRKLTGTSFYALCIYYKYGRMDFTSPPVYAFEGAAETLSGALDASNVESSAATDARKLPESSPVQGFGASLDMGMVHASYERMKFKDAPVANGSTVTLSLQIPVVRIISVLHFNYKERKKAKKDIAK